MDAPTSKDASSLKRPRADSPTSTPVPRPAPSLPPRPTVPPTPSLPPSPSPPLASFPIHPPAYYLQHSHSIPTTFSLPQHLTSFSYSPTRELLLSPERKDEALAMYRAPRLGSDLNTGFEECTWRDGMEDEGLDSLLDTLAETVKNDPTDAFTELLGPITLITWRGMMTKLLLAVYEVEGASRGRADGFEMNAMVIDGTLYLEDANSPSKLAKKASSESSYRLQSYYGYSFEAFSTVPPGPAQPFVFSPPNTNVQWCSVVKTNLGGMRMILGGEVDCVVPNADLRRIKTDDFIELKTNINIGSQREEMNFERQKLLKHYTQSFLLGVPRITVGFRTRQGQLTSLQTFQTLEIPRLVRGKPHGWEPIASLASGRQLLSSIHTTISQALSTVAHQTIFSSPDDADNDDEKLKTWPVFRVTFEPSGLNPGVVVRELSEQEVREEVVEGKKKEERVGFLSERWVKGARERRRKLDAKRQAETLARPAAPQPTTNGNGRPQVVLQR